MADIEPSENTIYSSIRTVLVTARQKAYTAVNSAMVEAYWDIGRQIMEAQEGQRAEYGTGLIKYLAERLTKEFGKGFTATNLKYMRQFYAAFPIGHTVCDQLSWSHYRLLMKIDNEPRREFYLKECVESNWSVRQLERQITTFYYERLLATQKEGKESVKNEILKTEPKTEPDYILKDPYILEFLDLNENKKYHKSEIEPRQQHLLFYIWICCEFSRKYSLTEAHRTFGTRTQRLIKYSILCVLRAPRVSVRRILESSRKTI
jgi:predicted nuclease of restriction endonuclease-like (RecB) superfamily